MAVRIICINKSGGYHENPHEAISNFGWVNEQTNARGNTDLAGIVKFLDVDKGQAYVVSGQSKAYCYTRQGKYRKFVQTYADNTPTDNLLSLPECKS